jgi:hypothetical protein
VFVLPDRIARLREVCGLDLTAAHSHRLVESDSPGFLPVLRVEEPVRERPVSAP